MPLVWEIGGERGWIGWLGYLVRGVLRAAGPAWVWVDGVGGVGGNAALWMCLVGVRACACLCVWCVGL